MGYLVFSHFLWFCEAKTFLSQFWFKYYIPFCSLNVIFSHATKVYHVNWPVYFVFLLLFSWQTGTAAVVLLSMSALGYIDLNIVPVNR